VYNKDMKKFLIILFILILSSPFLVTFLYSASALCEMAGCGMCGVIGHHIEKWLNSFIVIAIIEIGLFLVVYFLKPNFKEKFSNFTFKFKNLFEPLLFDPIKCLYSRGILNPQIYH